MKLEELSQRLRERDPAAVLVPPAALARLVQNVTGVTWAVWNIPHSHCISIDRATLRQYVEPEELSLPAEHSLPETVLVLVRPSADQLAASRNEELLIRYWRLLFHASVHRAIEQSLARIGTAELRERIERLGPVVFEEARNVLIEDGHLVAGADDRSSYIEFAAYFLELLYFAPNLVAVCFPSLPSHSTVIDLLKADVDGESIHTNTRLSGAPTPTPKTDDQSDESEDYYRRLTQSAERAAAVGDTVAAAILHTRAARVAPAFRTKPAQEQARLAIYTLVTRLQKALGMTDSAVAEQWRDVLPTLLDKADQGARPVEAALLYDLQRACLDAEQIIYTLDILEWLQSAGHKPIRRPLESQRFVRVPEHLRNAIRRLAAARLSDADRQRLGSLLRDALDRAEERLRERFRPVLTDALCDAGMKPTSLPERVALEKTVEELLDRISSTGYLGYADLRDAIARGQLKLADLSGPDKALTADPIVRLDRQLSHLLDGVYRRAELYTKALEFMTSMAFGTQLGRWFTRNIALPFGGSFIAAEFIWLLVFERQKPDSSDKYPDFFGGWNQLVQFHLIWVALAFFVLAAVHSVKLRSALMATGHTAFRCARAVLWDFPILVWNNQFMRLLLGSMPVQLVINYLVKPSLICGLTWLAVPEFFATRTYMWAISFLAAEVLVNTRLGKALDLLLLETARGIIDLIRAGPAVIYWVNHQFRLLLDALEWVLARSEDWLRIRGRSGTMAVVVRAIATVIWMPVAFFIRFYTVVLIEPMINPLKLPLSILFAKFVYPLLAVLGLFHLTPEIGSPLVQQLAPIISQPVAWFLVIGTFYLSPDLVTYLFWEMRENWRLYRANHPDILEAVSVGPHGETVRELLHVGFHSGTVPRLYARLRAAEEAAAETDVWRDSRTYRQALRGVEESVRRFVTRDLVTIVNGSGEWGGRKLSVGAVRLGTNRIHIELKLEEDPEPMVLEFEDRSDWLVAGCASSGFLMRLPARAFRIFENALVYLYKRAGVNLVREQIQDCLPRDAVHFDIARYGLLVWYGNRESTPLLYDPDEPQDDLRPRDPVTHRVVGGHTLPGHRLIFSRLELTWRQWLKVWQGGHEEKPASFGPVDWKLRLLPTETRSSDRVESVPVIPPGIQ